MSSLHSEVAHSLSLSPVARSGIGSAADPRLLPHIVVEASRDLGAPPTVERRNRLHLQVTRTVRLPEGI